MHGILISDRPLLVYDGEKLLSCVKTLNLVDKEATLSSGETAKFTHIIMPLPEVSQLLVHCGQPNGYRSSAPKASARAARTMKGRNTMTPPKLIGLTGPAGCGKSEVAKLLGGTLFSFATPIKQMVSVVLRALGHPPSLVHTQEGKATIIPELDCTVRHMLQTLGTEWGRQQIHPDVWAISAIRDALDSVQHSSFWGVFDDVRFDNEAQAIRESQGLPNIYGRIIHVTRDKDRLVDAGQGHASEAGVTPHPDDLWLYNDGTRGGLYASVCALGPILGFVVPERG